MKFAKDYTIKELIDTLEDNESETFVFKDEVVQVTKNGIYGVISVKKILGQMLGVDIL